MVALLMDKPAEETKFTTCKVDAMVLRRVKAAAALEGKDIQEFISDELNELASKKLKLPPLKRPKPDR